MNNAGIPIAGKKLGAIPNKYFNIGNGENNRY
jgi:hypothetical protein